MQEKSVGKNAALNMVKTVLSLLFPLITFPYISRVLQVEKLGRVNFAYSIVSYFVLFATLGLKTYGVREGAALRNDRVRFQRFFSQMLTITAVSTAVSLALLLLLAFSAPRLREYRALILILSAAVVLPTVGCEWVCAAYEDYAYITVRTLVVQLLSLILILALLHKPEDDYRYACILVFSAQGANLLNLFHIRRYVRFSLTGKPEAGRHLKPMLVLFASSLATTVYVSSDTTLLGLLSGEYCTGLYTAAAKLYTVIKNLVSAIVVVSIPRFSYYCSAGKTEEYNALLSRISKVLCLLAIPAAAGVFVLSEEIILLISGEAYMEAASALRILSVAAVFVAASWVQSQCVLIPMKKEKWVFYTTLAAAALNVLLNLVLIPRWQHNAAAFTTVIAEGTVALVYHFAIRKHVKIQGLYRQVFHGVAGSALMAVWLLFVKTWDVHVLLRLAAAITGGAGIYCLALLILKDAVAREMTEPVLRRLRKRR